MKHIKLKEFVLTKEEEALLIDYASYMGYVIDFEPEEFDGKYPIIRDKLNGKRKGYIQRFKGDLWYVYGTKRENISLSYVILTELKVFYEKSKSNLKKIFRYAFGIIDFEFKPNE